MDQHVQNEQQHPAEHHQTPNTFGPTNNLTNNKKESPLYLIHELAQYNKIQYQYWRSGEQGPDHKKLFTITLKLGNEEYEAEGTSIKKAQHSAAAMALQQTEFSHRPPKTKRNKKSRRIPPTVELNALAIKLRQKAVYVLEDGTHALQAQPKYYRRKHIYGPAQPSCNCNPDNNNSARSRPCYNYNPHHNNAAQNYHDRYENRYYRQKRQPFSIRLYVGEHEYPGMGDTIQAARHDAASKAIEYIKQKEIDDNQQCPVVNKNALPPTDILNELDTEIKFPISLVYEIASKRNLNVIFEVLREKGPFHRKVFITQCRVGDLTVEGEGNSKQISRKRAAEKMLKELKKLGPLPSTTNVVAKKRKRVVNRKKRKRVINSKKQSNLINVNSNQNSDYTEEIDPVSHLTQIQQANKEKEPVYYVSERGAKRRRRASVKRDISTDVGPIKKIPKRNDAEAMLALLGYGNSPAPQNTPKPIIQVKQESEQIERPQKVTFMEANQESAVEGSEGHQLVPGFLAVNDYFGAFQQIKGKLGSYEMLNSGFGSAPTEVNKTGQVIKKSPQVTHSVLSKDQFKTSYEKAALEAANVLAQLGLDNVTANKESNAESAGGRSTDKPQVIPKAKPNWN